MSLKSSREPHVAVFGAAGHTGRFVVMELIRRGIVPIAVTRNFDAFAAAKFLESRVLHRLAAVADAESLDQALVGAHAVINCAGPFLDTADGVAAAAVRGRIHYLDVSAEQPSTLSVLEKYDGAARKAGIAVIPAMAFFGGFADLLVTAALGDWEHAKNIEIMIGLDSWHPTRGTRITGERNTARRLVVTNGKLTPVTLPPSEMYWEFADPLGRQAMVEVPLSETILIAQHVKTTELHNYLGRVGLDDIRNPATPSPKAADATGRSAQRFMVDVVIRREGLSRRINACGRDIYAFSAPLVCEAAARLLAGSFSSAGAHPPGAVFDAREFLSALAPEYLRFEMTAA